MMNETQHTPRPWIAYVDPEYSNYEVVAEVNRGPFVVDVIARLPRFRPQFNGLPDELIANAALIAAAPVLLHRLTSLCDAVEHFGAAKYGMDHCLTLELELSRAALATATAPPTLEPEAV